MPSTTWIISFLRWAWYSRGTSCSGGSCEQHWCSIHSSTLVKMMVVISFTRIWNIKRESDSYVIGGGGIVDSGCHGWNFGRDGGGRRLFRCCWCRWIQNFCGGFYFSLNLELSFTTSTTAYAITRSPAPPSADAFTVVVEPASDSIKFNSPAAVYNFFGNSATILWASSLVSVGMGTSAASDTVDNILNASASAAVILTYSPTVFPQPSPQHLGLFNWSSSFGIHQL